ncbi:uncharacterized protein TNCV_4456601 [Trichonephila clavipes]|nr:uncharacterized protein TNCV_4456601 [Trichonephila clavipes]
MATPGSSFTPTSLGHEDKLGVRSTTASIMSLRYTFGSILTPSSTKTKSVMPLAQILPQTMTDFGYWFNNCRGAWSFHAPDSIVLGVMNLLNRTELLISEKDYLLTLTCGSSQKFSASSEPNEFVFFSEKLNFSQLVRLQSKLGFCYSPHRSVTYSYVKSDLSHGNPRISLDSLFHGLTIPCSVYSAFSPTSWTSPIIAKLFETPDCIRHFLSRYIPID